MIDLSLSRKYTKISEKDQAQVHPKIASRIDSRGKRAVRAGLAQNVIITPSVAACYCKKLTFGVEMDPRGELRHSNRRPRRLSLVIDVV